MLDILNRGHFGLRNLHLHLISDAGARIRPIVRHDKTAGRCCRQKRAADASRRNSQLSRALAIHLHVDAWVVQRLVILQIAKGSDFSQLQPEFFRNTAIGGKVRPSNIDFHGSSSAEVHDLGHDVGCFEGKLASRKLRRQILPEPFFKVVYADSRFRFQCDPQHSFVLTAGPKVNRVDGIIRRGSANVS